MLSEISDCCSAFSFTSPKENEPVDFDFPTESFKATRKTPSVFLAFSRGT
jgi:hypothetical protein